MEFTVGEEFEETTPDGRVLKVPIFDNSKYIFFHFCLPVNSRLPRDESVSQYGCNKLFLLHFFRFF